MKKIENRDLGRPSLEEYKTIKKNSIVIILDSIRSLNNVGAMFRTSDAFGVEKVFLCGITATPPNKEIHKTALGAELSVEWQYFEKCSDVVDLLRNDGYEILAVEQVEGSVMLNDFKVDSSKKYAIILGNEVNGVQQEIVDMCDGYLEIPQVGTKHSLNVSVAGGVVLWHLFRSLDVIGE